MPLPLVAGIVLVVEGVSSWWVAAGVSAKLASWAVFAGGVNAATGNRLSDAVGDSAMANLRKYRGRVIAGSLEKATGIALQIDDDGSISQQSITQAINSKLNTSFTNIFDREAIKSDLEKLALNKLNQNLGFAPDNPLITSFRDESAIREQIHGFAGRQVQNIIDGQSAPFLAPDAPQRIAAAALGQAGKYTRYIPQEANELMMDKKSINNRERQARYRRSHKREWRVKP